MPGCFGPSGPITCDVGVGLRVVLAGLALAKAVAVAIHLKDVDVVGQTIEKRPSETFGAKGFSPFVEWQVAGDQRGSALLALGDQFKQKLGPGFAQRNKAQLVNDQQFVTHHLLLKP